MVDSLIDKIHISFDKDSKNIGCAIPNIINEGITNNVIPSFMHSRVTLSTHTTLLTVELLLLLFESLLVTLLELRLLLGTSLCRK